jgi:hypothetical protein
MPAEKTKLPKQPTSKQLLYMRLMQWRRALLLPLLILWTSFAHYLVTNSFSFSRPPVLIGLVGILVIAFLISVLTMIGTRIWHTLIIAGLITYFIDSEFQTIVYLHKYVLLTVFLGFFVLSLKWEENVRRIATTVFATCLVSTLALPILIRAGTEFHISEKTAHAARSPLPRIVHLILDEHIGVEGIPTGIESGQAIKDTILRFYQQYGFSLYGNAFSHYSSTYNSIPNLFNFSADAKAGVFLASGDAPQKLQSNKYFRMLFEKHFDINVFGPEAIDFCEANGIHVHTCHKYPGLDLGVIADLDLPISDQLRVVFAGYLNRSMRYQRVRFHYQSMRPRLILQGIPLPAWTWDKYVVPYAANTMAALTRLSEDILAMPPGSVMVAHLLLPHFPYVYRENCSTHASLQEFKSRTLTFEEMPQMNRYDNTAESREERYRLYFQQLQCLYARLDDLFRRMRVAGIFENSIIILHGDHGSRIGLHDPYFENLDVLSKEDYTDAFSTLFAVKLPGKPGGYDLSVRPLEQLLAEALNVPLQSAGTLATRESEPFVYLRPRVGKDLVRVSYSPAS